MSEQINTDPRILLIDDEQAILDMITIVLQKEGFRRIKTAVTGREAIEHCAAWHPDLIVLDVMLPDLEGFDVCRRDDRGRGGSSVPAKGMAVAAFLVPTPSSRFLAVTNSMNTSGGSGVWGTTTR